MKRFITILVIIYWELSAIGQSEKQLFTFEPDLRIFTAYAFYNASGYDHDWLKMDSIRIETRKYIDSILQDSYKVQIQNYSSKTNLNWGECGFYALYLENAPSLKWSTVANNTDLKNKYPGLDTLLSDFYYKANIKYLWDKYKKFFSNTNYSYKPYAQKALNDIVMFTKIKSDFYSNYSSYIHFMICPLMSHWTAFNYTINDTLYLVQGPNNGELGPYVFYHEALHPPIGQIIENHKELNVKWDKLNARAQEKLKGNYNDIIALLNECFVRTIDKYLSGQYAGLDEEKIKIRVEDEYKLGFIFCPYIYENIPQFLNSKKSLDEYYPLMMSNLNVDKEIERWDNYQKH